jgi:hypothetical protein
MGLFHFPWQSEELAYMSNNTRLIPQKNQVAVSVLPPPPGTCHLSNFSHTFPLFFSLALRQAQNQMHVSIPRESDCHFHYTSSCTPSVRSAPCCHFCPLSLHQVLLIQMRVCFRTANIPVEQAVGIVLATPPCLSTLSLLFLFCCTLMKQ